MSNIWLISSDSHVMEPPDLWETRVDKRYRNRTPTVVTEEDADYWFIDGVRAMSFQGGAQTGRRFDDPQRLSTQARWDEVREGSYVAQEFVNDNRADSVDVSFVYPTLGLFLFNIPSQEIVTASCRAYNDWIIDFCAPFPDALKGLAMINMDEVPEAIEELERAHQRGLVGAMITVYPPEDRAYDLSMYDPFWEAAESLAMPLSFHIGTNRSAPGQGMPFLETPLAKDIAADYWLRVSLANMIFAGVFERYPNLKVISTEHDLNWAPMLLGRMDYTYTQRHRGVALPRFRNGMMPSDFFHRNVFLSFQEDPVGIRERDLIGVDNLMWGSDYPHQESTFPKSREVTDRILEGVPEDERMKILRGNVARVYNLE
ncbi:amidohydrolase [SAR202 cluster bacterium AD-804-J14_MRT_500m]|nr:amidohydrolase [SAR202 cluster bacterium AD-804-J14_MRT_500m]